MVDCVFLSCPIMNLSIDGRLFPVMQDAARESPALGVYTLVACLEAEGVDCDVLDWVSQPEKSIDAVVDALLEYEILFFSANSMNWGTVMQVASACKNRRSTVKICLGGPHATHFPESVIATGLFSSLFRGDADKAIHLIYKRLRHGSEGYVPGYWQTGDSTIPMIHVEQNFSSCDPLPRYDYIPSGVFKCLPVETSRGCKFQCSFCSITSMKNWRGRSVEQALRRINHAEKFVGRSTCGVISIIDDTFTTDHDRIHALCRELTDKRFERRINFDATVVDLRNEALISSLSHIASHFLVGAEVATKEDAKRIRKAATPELIEGAARNLHKGNMADRAVFSFIIGFPWHSLDHCLEVVNFALNLIFKYGIKVYLQWYWPMPGSAIWEGLRKEGLASLDMLNEPGFFLTERWFYSIRALTPDEINKIDEKIKIAQLLANVGVQRHDGANSLEYSSPQIKESQWDAKRFAFLS